MEDDDQQNPIISSTNPNNNLPMQQRFIQLQNHWNHYKTCSKSNHFRHPTMPHNDSPPQDDLISSLHRHGTAPYSASSTWKIRTNQLAQDEIRRERKAVIASGNFNCRRLSYDDVDFDIGLSLNEDFLHGDYWNGFPQDQIVAPSIQSSDSPEEKEEELPVCLNGLSYSSASSSSSSYSELGKEVKEQMAANAKVEENATPTVGEKTEIGNWCKIGKWELILAWLLIVSIVMLIFSVRCLGLGAYDEQRLPFLLVPT